MFSNNLKQTIVFKNLSDYQCRKLETDYSFSKILINKTVLNHLTILIYK